MHEIRGQQQDKDGHKKIVMICCHLKQTSKKVTSRKIKWEDGHQDARGELMWSLGCFVCGHAYVCMCYMHVHMCEGQSSISTCVLRQVFPLWPGLTDWVWLDRQLSSQDPVIHIPSAALIGIYCYTWIFLNVSVVFKLNSCAFKASN